MSRFDPIIDEILKSAAGLLHWWARELVSCLPGRAREMVLKRYGLVAIPVERSEPDHLQSLIGLKTIHGIMRQEQVLRVERTLPNLKAAKLGRAIDLQLPQMFPLTRDEAYYAWGITSRDRKANTCAVEIFCTRRSDVEALRNELKGRLVSLAPSETATRFWQHHAWDLGAARMMVLLSALAIVLSALSLNALEMRRANSLEHWQGQVTEAQSRAAETRRLAQEVEVLTRDHKRLAETLSSGDLRAFLGLISQHLPGGAWAEALEINASRLVLDIKAEDPIAAVSALRQVSSFKSVTLGPQGAASSGTGVSHRITIELRGGQDA